MDFGPGASGAPALTFRHVTVFDEGLHWIAPMEKFTQCVEGTLLYRVRQGLPKYVREEYQSRCLASKKSASE